MVDEGMGTVLIASRLNAAGHRERKGGIWSGAQVRRLMKTPFLKPGQPIGVSAVMPRGTRSYVVGNSGFNRNFVIIDSNRWQAAMDKMGPYSHGQPHQPHYTRADQGTLLFTGFAHCGDAMVAVLGYYWVRRKAGDYKGSRVSYGCMAKVTKGTQTCTG